MARDRLLHRVVPHKIRALATLLSVATILGLAVFVVPLFKTYLADGFTPGHIRTNVPSQFTSSHLTPDIELKLSLPFHYLGKGSQCYVFLSSDGETVLKFFRHHRYRLPLWANHLTLPPFLAHIQEAHLQKKEEKRERFCQSLVLAMTYLQEECGLLYLHSAGNPLPQTVTVKDRLGFTYHLPLTDFDFVVQQRADPLTKQDAAALAMLLTTRFSRGIGDTDPVVKKNAGKLGDNAIFLDIGSFYEDESLKDPTRFTKEIKQLLADLD